MAAQGFIFMAILAFCGAVLTAGDDFDPRKIPASERIAYINRLASEGIDPNDNAAEHYRAASKAFKSVLELSPWDPDPNSEAQRRPYKVVDSNAKILGLRGTWSDAEARVLREWLDANKTTLAELQKAAERERCFFALPPEAGRLSEASLLIVDNCFGLVELMLVSANDCMRRGDWAEAWRWNWRTHRMGMHHLQGSFVIQHMIGRRMERLALDQFRVFVERDARTWEVDQAWQHLDGNYAQPEVRRANLALVRKAEALFDWDSTERAFAWAHGNDDQKFGELVGNLLSLHSDLCPDGISPLGDRTGPPYRDADELDAALQRTNLDEAWRVLVELQAFYDRWDAQPFHEAWREAAEFRAKYCELARPSPWIAVLACDCIFLPDRNRLTIAYAETARNATRAVVAIESYRARHNELPPTLAALVPEFLKDFPPDLFSGQPLIYRLTGIGRGYTLYSVGENQRDDGGRVDEEHPERGDVVFWPVQIPGEQK